MIRKNTGFNDVYLDKSQKLMAVLGKLVALMEINWKNRGVNGF